MQNFKKILNNLANKKSEAAAGMPCCWGMMELQYATNREVIDLRLIGGTAEALAKIRPSLFFISIKRLIRLYCECKNSPQTPQEANCAREIEKFIKNGIVKTVSPADPKLILAHAAYIKVLFQAFKFFKKTATLHLQIHFDRNIDSSDNIDFMRNFCDFYNPETAIGENDLLRDIIGSMIEEVDILFKEALEEFLQLIPTVGGAEEAQILDCEVSAENDSVKGWAAALAVSAATAAAAIALYRITRGRSAKSCTPSGKTKGVRILSGLLCGAAAGSATQNAPSQETCNAIAEQIINDECSPNPSLCEPPSGGGGSQPPGGEVEPPSGGGGGVMGGDGLL